MYCRRFKLTCVPAGIVGESANGVGNWYRLLASMKKPTDRGGVSLVDEAPIEARTHTHTQRKRERKRREESR